MREDLGDHRRIFDRGDDLQVPATVLAVFDIEVEDALEKPRPTHARRHVMRVMGSVLAGVPRWIRNDRGTQPGVGREHAMETDQMQARTRHQRGLAAA